MALTQDVGVHPLVEVDHHGIERPPEVPVHSSRGDLRHTGRRVVPVGHPEDVVAVEHVDQLAGALGRGRALPTEHVEPTVPGGVALAHVVGHLVSGGFGLEAPRDLRDRGQLGLDPLQLFDQLC
ncbi:MAG: hypothetical protein ABEL76_14755 [Bradymonadaceae bacterium]